MNKSLIRSRWAAIGAAVAVTLGGGAVMVANAATSATESEQFWAVTPCRLLDTRNDGAAGSKIFNAGIRKGAVQDKTKGNTADNDIVVIFDAAAVDVAGNDNFTLNYASGDFRPIMGDCNAEFTSGGDFENLMAPTADVPTALLLNVTTVGMSQNGFVTVYPWQTLLNDATPPAPATGTDVKNRPFFSNLNPIASLPSVSNNVTVKLKASTGTIYIPAVKCDDGSHGTNGSDCSGYNSFRVYNENGNTHVIIDVLGYYTNEG